MRVRYPQSSCFVVYGSVEIVVTAIQKRVVGTNWDRLSILPDQNKL